MKKAHLQRFPIAEFGLRNAGFLNLQSTLHDPKWVSPKRLPGSTNPEKER
jgi:hypothetical protein